MSAYSRYYYMAIVLVILAVIMDLNLLKRVTSIELFSLSSKSLPLKDDSIPTQLLTLSNAPDFSKNLQGQTVWIWNADTPSRELSESMSLLVSSHDPSKVNIIQTASPSDTWQTYLEKHPLSSHSIWVNNSFCNRYCLSELVIDKKPSCSCGHGFSSKW